MLWLIEGGKSTIFIYRQNTGVRRVFDKCKSGAFYFMAVGKLKLL